MVDSWQFILIVMLIMMFLNYLLLKFFMKNYMPSAADEDEAFETREGFSGGNAESTDIQEFGNMDLYENSGNLAVYGISLPLTTFHAKPQ